MKTKTNYRYRKSPKQDPVRWELILYTIAVMLVLIMIMSGDNILIGIGLAFILGSILGYYIKYAHEKIDNLSKRIAVLEKRR